jgi:filamentous hemagglutinin
MAVSEVSVGKGKAASGERRGRNVVLALFAFALSPLAWAQVIADPNAPGNQTPQIVTSANGVTQVNIQTPSAGGVSRNVYSQFDVNAQGVILNNSTTNVQTQLGGWVQSNGNLAGGSARVILNEVNSSNPSQLRGFVEVAGQRAEVIIANPAGIAINGGGFINASGVTLTTGTPAMNGGNLDGYRVQRGTITVDGAGLDTSNADYTNIIARAIQVNAGIWAKDLKVTAGANDVNAANTTRTAIAGTGTAPTVALDVAALGGMYAGKITLVGTEAGLGVRNAGSIAANGGPLVVQANGMLTNTGLMEGQTAVIKATTVNNTGSGQIYGDTVAIQADTLNNTPAVVGQAAPVIAARTGRMDLGVGTLNNQEGAVIYSQGDLAIGGSLDANNLATGRASTVTNNSATIESLGSVDIKTQNLTNSYTSLTYRVEAVSSLPGSSSCGDDCYSNYTETTYRAVAVDGVNGAGKILATNNITLDASNNALNSSSQILAGGVLNITGTAVNNQGIDVALFKEQRGTTYQRRTERYWDWGWKERAWWEESGYSNNVADNQTVQRGESPPTSPAARSAFSPNASTVANLPTSAQYRINNNLGDAYLVEANPRFANMRTWLGSDYMLASLALDPSVTQKRLGDGFYEQRLINEQVAQLTGRRYLGNYTSDEAQYQALMNGAITYAQTYNLRPGIALTAEQVAQLTSDIVWLVEKEVTLNDGSKQRVLVPQVYAMVREGDLSTTGALLSGDTVNINTSGDVSNSGSILGRQLVQITAQNVNNLAGLVQGDAVNLQATQDINNIGGTVAAQSNLTAVAGRDLNVESTTKQTANTGSGRSADSGAQGLAVSIGASGGGGGVKTTNETVSRVAGLYVTKAGGTLLASAGRDANLIGALIQSNGDATIAATENLNFKTINTSSTFDATIDADNFNRNSRSAEVGTSVQTTGNLTLQAGQNFTARAADVQAAGKLNTTAGNDVTIEAGVATQSESSGRTTAGNSFFAASLSTDRQSSSSTQAVASNFAANSITAKAGQDLIVTASNLNATQNADLSAGKDVIIASGQATSTRSSYSAKTESGFSASSMGAISYGTSEQSQDTTTRSTTQVASTVSGSNVSINSGRDATVKASNVLADQDITISAARNINILAAANTQTSAQHSTSSSTTIGLTPDAMGRQTFFGQTDASQNGNNTSVQQSTSVLSANGGNLTLQAGNGATGNITTQGAELLADKTITLTAAAVDLQAITDSQTSTSQSKTSSLTIGSALSGAVGNLVTAIGTNVDLSQNTQNERLKSAAALKAGYDAYKLAAQLEAAAKAAKAAEAAGSAGAKAAGPAIGVSISIASASSEQNSSALDTHVRGSNLQAKDIVITATQGDITATAAKLQAETIALDAAQNVNLQAGVNTTQNTSSNSSNNAGVGVSFGFGDQNGFSIQLSAAQAQGRSNGTETTYDNTQLTASNSISIKSGADTTLKGAQLAADKVTMDVGGKLAIETLQDTSTFTSEQSSSGFNMSLCLPPICYGAPVPVSGSINQSNQNLDHNYQSAVGQSGIAAGQGGFDIKVAGNTDLKGAAITSTATADKNTLSTASLTSSDLDNRQNTNSSSSSMNLGYSGASTMATLAQNATSNALANLSSGAGMPENGSQSGKTSSVISAGNIVITGTGDTAKDANSAQQVATLTSRDATTANQTLSNTLTLQQAQALQAKQKEAQENAQVGQLVGSVAFNVVGDIAQKNGWENSSPQKIALHAIAGFIQASAAGQNGATGALAAMGNEAFTQAVNAYIDKALPMPENATTEQQREVMLSRKALAESAASLLGATTVALAGGSNQQIALGGAVALNADRFNRQLHPTKARLIKDNAAKFAKQLNGGKEPTQAQIDAAQERLTSTTLNQVDSAFDKRITTEDAQAQAFLRGLASQYGNIDVGGGKLFDARGTAAFNNHTINAQYLGQTAPLYNQLDSKDLKGIAPNVRGAYVAYSDASNDPNLNKLTQGQVLAISAQGKVLQGQATSTQEVLSVMSANQGRAEVTMGKGGLVKPGDGSKLEGDNLQGLTDSALTAPGDGSPAGGSLGPRTKVNNKLPSTNSELVPVQIVKPSPGVEFATVNGQQIKPQNYQQLYHGTDNATLGFPSSMKPEDVAQQLYTQGLPERGSNIDLIDHATNNPSDKAFRGTTTLPLSPNKDAGAVHWAGEGGLVIELKNVPGYDVNAALEGQIKTMTGYKKIRILASRRLLYRGRLRPGILPELGWYVRMREGQLGSNGLNPRE